MPSLDQALAKIEAKINATTTRAQKQADRLKIIRSYKGDTSKCAAELKATKLKLATLQEERQKLRNLMQAAAVAG